MSHYRQAPLVSVQFVKLLPLAIVCRGNAPIAGTGNSDATKLSCYNDLIAYSITGLGMESKSITEKYAIVRTEARSITLSRVWFEMFLDLINAGWHRQYTFLGETHTFSSLSEFIEHKDGLESDPIALYLAVEACSKNSGFAPYASDLMAVFESEGFNPVLDTAKPLRATRTGRPALYDSVKILELRSQGMTQKQVAESVGCSRQNVAKVEKQGIPQPEELPTTTKQGTSSEYWIRRTKRDYPEEYESGNVGKGKKYPTARSLAIAKGDIRTPLKLRIFDNDNGEEILEKLSQKLSKEQLRQLKEACNVLAV